MTSFVRVLPVLVLPLLVSGLARADETVPLAPLPSPPPATAPVTAPPPCAESTGPRELVAEEGMRVPPGYTAVERTRRGVVAAGISIFASVYLLTALGASIADAGESGSPAGLLYAPVVGPFLQMTRGVSADGAFWLGVDGALQGLGVGLIAYGAASKKIVFVRNDLVVAPMVTTSSAGATVVGTF